jgi:hypothetical protein
MLLRVLFLVLSAISLPFAASAADVPLVTLGGEVGAAAKASINRERRSSTSKRSDAAPANGK